MSANRRARRFWLLGGALAAAVMFGPGLIALAQLSWERRRLDHQLAALAARQEALVREQERLEQDDAYVEGLIRTTFKLAQPGEYVIPLSASESDGKSR